MTITIDLPPEVEAKLREQATTKGAKLEEYLSELARHWAGVTGASLPIPPFEKKTPKQKVAELIAWADSHSHITANADDSRESIYDPGPTIPPESKTQEGWENEWRAWAASHKPVGVVVDDSRESIYAGRGC